MAIYDKPTWQLMRDMAAELLPDSTSILTKAEVHAWFAAHYSKIKTGTIDAHLAKMSTNHPSRIHYNVKSGLDDLLFRIDTQRYRRYASDSDPQPIYVSGAVATSPEPDEDVAIEGADTEFAYEADLRDYLARNLGLIEPGLRLYQDEDIRGIEYPVGGRFIDILAVDKDGGFVVIELKVSRGYDRVIGQLFRYVGWIRQNLAEPGQRVRGVIVAREISQDLKLACAEAGNVGLFEYKLSISLSKL